jgi:hypothetical protein
MDSENRPQETALRKVLRAFFDTPAGAAVFNIAGYVQVAGIVLFVATLIYLVLAVLTGELAKVGPEVASATRFQWVGMAFLYSVIGLSLALVIRNGSDDTLMGILGVAGAGIYFGVPMLLTFGLSRSGDVSEQNAAVQILTRQCMFLGFYLWSLTALRVCIFAVDRIITGTNQDELPVSNRDFISKQVAKPLKPSIGGRKGPFARCWEQPHCIDFIREVCRPWAEKRSCWRIQSGCMCDVRYLYDAMRQDNTLGVRADAGMDELIPEAESMGGGSFARKLYCKDCRIYVEHQRRKFRVLSPLALPITAVIMFAASPIVIAIYKGLVGFTSKAIQTMWLSDSREAVATRFQDQLGNEAAAYAALVLCGIFVLSAVMRSIEWLTLELKV